VESTVKGARLEVVDRALEALRIAAERRLELV
jgi:hypothetical protein